MSAPQSIARRAPEFRHALVVGGTGMLRLASLELMKRSEMVTSVARTRSSLWALDALCPPGGARHRLVIADWSRPKAFIGAVRSHVLQFGHPELAVVWTHEPGLAIELMSTISGPSGRCLFLHLIGNRVGNPLAEAFAWRERHPEPPGPHYRQVVLGYERGRAGWRWLTHDEICEGVLEAIEAQVPRFIVGRVSPWPPRG
jgi:hypothetical protein